MITGALVAAASAAAEPFVVRVGLSWVAAASLCSAGAVGIWLTFVTILGRRLSAVQSWSAFQHMQKVIIGVRNIAWALTLSLLGRLLWEVLR